MLITYLQVGVNDCSPAVLFSLRLSDEEGLPAQPHAYMQLLSDMVSDILDGKRQVWLALDNDTPIGSVQIKCKLDPYFGRYYECAGLYVDPEYRLKGIARRLLKTALDYHAGEDPEIPIVLISGNKVRNFYSKLGFKPAYQIYTSKVDNLRKVLR